METSFTVIILAAATMLVLVAGLIIMAIGGKINQKYSNKLMIARVVLQGLAIAMLALLMFCGKH